jgi:hypothetical protein
MIAAMKNLLICSPFEKLDRQTLAGIGFCWNSAWRQPCLIFSGTIIA